MPKLDLTQPLSWESASLDEIKALRNLQGNILKGHGRSNATILFIQFENGKRAEARAFLRWVCVMFMRDAHSQLLESKHFKETGESGETFVGLALSAAAYRDLEIPDDKTPTGQAFSGGMRARQTALKDPTVDQWEPGYQKTIHAVIVIADDLQARVADVRAEIEAELARTGVVIARENGQAMHNDNGDGIEHFGYVDGRSQPLMLVEDIVKEPGAHWDPAFPLSAALIEEPGSDPELGRYGSFFVFRKLEQNVRGFKEKEEELAAALGLTGADAELAGALAVGRFEDGTPVVLHQDDGRAHPVPNDFSYAIDPKGSKCPFHAHIRKTNPRGDTTRVFGAPEAGERLHIMPRRGIPYGTRPTHPNDEAQEQDHSLYPTGGVGLLFMAYNVDIERQFEFTQISWANNQAFVDNPTIPANNTGIDPVIGQGRNDEGLQKWPNKWGVPAAGTTGFDFHGFVTMKGGEYFFAPSLPFLREL